MLLYQKQECTGNLSNFNEIFLSVKGNLDNDVGCWRCNPTGSADCSEHKDIYCHPRAIAKTGNDDFTSKKVSLENVIS